MPKWGYSFLSPNPDRTAKASGRELRVSHKAAREVCNTIKKMELDQAKDFLRKVISMEKPVPFLRFNKKAGHRRGLKKGFAGRYPVKVANKVLKILEEAESNAEFKGLDLEKLRIIHAAAYPGMRIRRMIPRAFGRSSPKNQTLCHVELILEEVRNEAF